MKQPSSISIATFVHMEQDWVLSAEDEAGWQQLMQQLEGQFKQKMRMEALLLLIGMREMGIGNEELDRNVKMDLMHVGMCAVLAPAGYYALTHRDEDGWPHYELALPLPFLDLFKQVNFLRYHLLRYFEAVFEAQ